MVKKFTAQVVFLLAFCLAFVLILTSCKCIPGLEKKIVEVNLGEYSSLSGSLASFGINTHLGIQLALKEFNAKADDTGYRFKLITIDNEGDEKKAALAVENLVKQKAVAIIGEVSSNLSIAGARVAQQYKVPMISPGSTSTKVTKIGEYIFRACFDDTFQGTVMARFAYDDLKARKVAILRDTSSEYSIGLAESFISKFKELGGEILIDEKYKSGELDFKIQLLKIKAKKSDAIYVPGYYTEMGLIARQARQLGIIDAKFLGGDGWDSSQLYSIGGEAINGAFFTNHFAVESPEERAKTFVANFRREYELIPDANAALAYDSAYLIINAVLKSQSTDPEKIRIELNKTKNFPGVTGDISFSAGRGPIKGAVIVQVDGKINRFVTTVSP
ncbi:MAG: ABC transporter substrate-binding protein [Pseudomonadota bacterium]|nr:ABC transporter substrate-binding protein [Pseudomonadota bacterium]